MMLTIVAFLKRFAIPIIGVVFVLVIVSAIYRRVTRHDQLDPAVQDSVAVLKASRKADSVAHAGAVANADTLGVKSAASTAQSKIAEQTAAALRSLADASAALARASRTAQDSARYYHAAFDQERQRGDSLQVALAKERQAADDARAATREAMRADSLEVFREKRLEELNANLVKEAARLSAGCRLLPGVPCLSRIQTAGVTAIATYVLVQKYRKP